MKEREFVETLHGTSVQELEVMIFSTKEWGFQADENQKIKELLAFFCFVELARQQIVSL